MTFNHKTCSFFGLDNLKSTKENKTKFKNLIKYLIMNKKIKNFYFCNCGIFCNICHDIIMKLKLEYSDIQNVNYSLEEFKSLDKHYFTLLCYQIYEMIYRSSYVVVYVNNKKNNEASKILKYALKKKKQIINIC